MKKIHLLFLSFLAFLMIGITPGVQAQLSVGDVAVIYARFDPTDTVTVLTLVPLSIGDRFYITDQTLEDNGGAGPQAFDNGTAKAACFTASAAIDAFTVITYDAGGPTNPSFGTWQDYTAVHGPSSVFESGVLSLSSAGDQVFVFIDSNTANGTEPGLEPTFIFGLQSHSSGWSTNLATSNTSGSQSVEPRVDITNMSSALLSTIPASLALTANLDNYIYNGPTSFTDKADALSEITLGSNWLGTSSSPTTGTGVDTRSSTIHKTSNPFSGPAPPALVPTMSEWGLIVLALLMLAMATVAMMVSSGRVQTADGTSFSMFSPKSLPFEVKGFTKMLAIVMGAVISIFAVAMLGFGYELTGADVPGTLIASPIAAYILHLWMEEKK